MPDRKPKRKGPFDIFGLNKDNFIFGSELKTTKGESGSGYSLSVTYDEQGKPVVKVKTYGNVDVAELRQDIQQRYPGAKIEGLEKQPLVRIVDEEKPEKKPEKKAEPEKLQEKKKEKKESLIRIVE